VSSIGADGFMPLPVAVIDHRSSGVLELQWPDGATSRLPHALLRSCCRCAACEHVRRSADRDVEAHEAVRLRDMRPVADKGLNLVFSDGHARGIYPWNYLRELGDARGGGCCPALRFIP
jgi:DUF971 family protein